MKITGKTGGGSGGGHILPEEEGLLKFNRSFFQPADESLTALLQGRDAIQAIIKDINDPLIPKIPYSGNRFYDKAQAKSHIDERISMLYYNNTSSMGNYFHLLEIIIRSIDKARISDGDREIYLEILKGKISDAEITFILYFTMRAGSKVLRDYADKYNLFKRATGALLPQVVLDLFNFRPNDP